MTWDGAWVSEALGVRVTTTHAPLGVELPDLVGLAVRRNPRRAHLLVSHVLGKHVPVDPRLARGAGLALGALVADVLAPPAAGHGQHDRDQHAELGATLRSALTGGPAALPEVALRCARQTLQPGLLRPGPLVLGYAETATALGHCVAEALDARAYLHSTRRHVATAVQLATFEESHSHATRHLLLPTDPALLVGAAASDAGDGPLVLVDDELSTGATALRTIEALHALHPRAHYVLAALVDLRDDADRACADALAVRLGVRLDVVALAGGRLEAPADVVTRGAALVAAHAPGEAALPDPVPLPSLEPPTITRVDLRWPVDLPEGGRHGLDAAGRARWEALLPGMAATVERALDAAVSIGTERVVHVLGTEELLQAPLRLAQALAERLQTKPAGSGGPRRVVFSSTTRSPVLAVDVAGYAIRSALTFPAHDVADADDRRYVYNTGHTAAPPPSRGDHGSSAFVVVVDDAGDTPALHAAGGLLDQLARQSDPAVPVLLVVLPTWRPLPPALRGPDFGSYPPDEVAWLLTDLSGVALEAPTEEREEAVQSGGAHYAESLPVEYQPDAAYTALYDRALEAGAARLAHAVGVLTELVLAERGSDVVLASLARAGTPVGILVRRWAARRHGLDLPHVAVSIVRGRGLDPVAVRALAATTDPSRVVFVDGWTGKGAIARELTAALARADTALGLAAGHGFDPRLAVLADPGGCTSVFGTREDFLVPSACLNSTVSGLVSRTVDNAAVLPAGTFHGAKFYRELAGADVSRAFCDAVAARFDDVADDVARDWPLLAASDRRPTWAGWAAVEAIAARYGVGSVNLVKPGVGETTRVLLRRVPWRVLVRRPATCDLGSGADLDHVRLLADQRGVPVEEVDDLPYACVGLIHPRYTRGATGTDGRAVSSGAGS